MSDSLGWCCRDDDTVTRGWLMMSPGKTGATSPTGMGDWLHPVVAYVSPLGNVSRVSPEMAYG